MIGCNMLDIDILRANCDIIMTISSVSALKRLLDFEKYLVGNELQIGGFDLLYKAWAPSWAWGSGGDLVDLRGVIGLGLCLDSDRSSWIMLDAIFFVHEYVKLFRLLEKIRRVIFFCIYLLYCFFQLLENFSMAPRKLRVR